MEMISAIVLAGGMGRRMGGEVSKQFLKLNDNPILYYSIKAFDDHPKVDEIVIVIRRGEEEIFEKEILSKYQFKKNIKIIRGGAERSDSVENGLSSLHRDSEIVLIHDGVRPFLDKRIIDANIDTSKKFGACVTGVASKDTVKIVDESGNIIDTPLRDSVFLAQTPQTFKKEIIVDAFENAELDRKRITDDSMAVELLGLKVKMVDGNYENIKLTTPEDLIIGAEIARRRGL